MKRDGQPLLRKNKWALPLVGLDQKFGNPHTIINKRVKLPNFQLNTPTTY